MGFKLKKAFKIPKKVRKWKPLKKPLPLLAGVAALAIPGVAPALLKGAGAIGKGALAGAKFAGKGALIGARTLGRGVRAAGPALGEAALGGVEGLQAQGDAPEMWPVPSDMLSVPAANYTEPRSSSSSPAGLAVSPAMLAAGAVALVLLLRRR